MKNNAKVVTYNLEASEFPWQIAEGKTINAWGFNQQLPGPTLKARKGDELVINVKNSLSQPTIVHWHGIRLPAAMDGTGEMQQPIQPGEIFQYRFTVPDAGSFWYHSHANETVQMERGLYGALIVEDETDPVVDNERVFMIDDMKLTDENEFTKAAWFLPRWVETHDGRQGNTLLINGKMNTVIDMSAGQSERWRFINSSSARYFELYLGGRTFKIIGTDGGLIESPVEVTEYLITPGERLDIVVGPFEAGDLFHIESLAYNRMTFLRAKRQRFATVRVGSPAPTKAYVPRRLRRIDSLVEANAEINRSVKLSVGITLNRGAEFLVNGKKHVNDKPVYIGELQVWEIYNASLMDHPFHLHGFFFQVLEINGKKPILNGWKDTVNLEPRSKAKIAWIPDNRPGTWMYHCHILEHHQAGMMANFDVVDRSKAHLLPEKPAIHQHCH